ncbi:MAG: replication-associated recombination protein A [Armatimonadetes bacterium]|nr:replication-associated recombination protein A [Candidatus Hippobium faecium]
MDIFEEKNSDAPLAARMRPKQLSEFYGQEEITGPDSLVRRLIESDNLSSLIFWGTPGCGKSTLANIIANTTQSAFVSFSAVIGGVGDLRKIIDKAKENKKYYNKKTILFIDEIHRFNKGQQDALLPYVEDGTVTLIGATTENPYFEVNTPLLSRSRIVRFRSLDPKALRQVIDRALTDKECGLGNMKIILDEEVYDFIFRISAGDARSALNILEMCVKLTPGEEKHITVKTCSVAAGEKTVAYDKGGDMHYDVISAFIKSMRGSDPDAAIYYLALMLQAGEDIKFIARRVCICASEDVGNADPMAMVVANNAAQAVQFVGMPEARIPLAQAVAYVACAPKSNASCVAIDKAMSDVKNNKIPPVPIHLRDAHYNGAKKLGHGIDYKYAHDFPGAWVDQQYLPDGMEDKEYYLPSDRGHEKVFRQRLEAIKAAKKRK